ncbi:MAG TPA: hypothetical protein VIG36_14840 [Methylocystis sp.]
MSNPFERPKAPSKGDRNPEAIYLSVGRALSTWEHTERSFAGLFAGIVSPSKGSFPARRAYGTIISQKNRREMIEKASEAFFAFFKDEDLEKALKETLNFYSDAAARRNDIAHGIVLQPKLGAGYFLTANLYTSKRKLYADHPYYYNSQIIDKFSDSFSSLSGSASHIINRMAKLFAASPKTPRERY